jgi:Ser-tRNA(Ala) deacylase AlaX
MDDFGVTSCDALVSSVASTDDDRTDIVLDQTCFYARGGGQDWDTGTIDDFQVEEVRLDEQGIVHHIGKGPLPQPGQQVHCQVDAERRGINTRLHSAGHVIDMVNSTLYPDWIPGRGAHYPHMSFVEYEQADVNDMTQQQIQEAVNATLSQNLTNTLRYMDKADLAKVCRHVPDNLPANKPIRVVLYGGFGVPCGGTHVQNLSDIGKIEVTKVKTKKGVTKVSYRVEGIN